MKQLSKYLAEKLIVNRNYRGLGYDEQKYDPEELVTYVLEHFEILPNNQTTKLSLLNKISSNEYDDLYDKLHHLFVDKFDFVKYKNIKFLASERCIRWLDDDLQNSYNESDIEDEVWINDPKLLKTVDKFSIFYVYNESVKTIRIFYYKAINAITLVCDIDI